MKSLRRVAGIVIAGLAASTLAACNGAPARSGGFQLSPGTPPAKGDLSSFSWALYAEPPSLDYIFAFDYEQNMILSNVCESLMRWTPQLTLQPGLAESVTNPDPLTWVYDIRPNVHFQDGSVMTADDVVYSLRRQLDPDLGSYWNSVFVNVKSIVKTGPMRVTINLSRPDSQLPQLMATSAGSVSSAKYTKAEGRKYGTADGGSLDCTGPYTLTNWAKGQSITLSRFAGYWGTPAKTGKVTFKFITDTNAWTDSLVTGETDGGYLVPPQAFARLKSVGDLYYGQGLTTEDLIVSNLKGTLGDVRVRQALSMAIDKPGFLKAALGGMGTVAQAVAPRGSWQGIPSATVAQAYSDLPPTTPDLAGAKKLIQQAGATGKSITVVTSPVDPSFAILANEVQSAGAAIGLKVQIKTVAPDAFTALFSSAQARAGVDLIPTAYYLSATDPLDLYGIFQTGQFENYGGYSNPALDKLITAATEQYDPAKRALVTAQIQKFVTDQALWIPVADIPATLFMDKRITGAPTTISYLYYPWAADVGAAR